MTTLLNLYFLVIWNRHLSEVPTSYGAAIPGAPDDCTYGPPEETPDKPQFGKKTTIIFSL
jgi:hypothetical protein